MVDKIHSQNNIFLIGITLDLPVNNIDLIGTFHNWNIKYSFHNINFSQKSLSTVTINQNFNFDNNIKLMVPSCKHNLCIYKTLKSSTEDNVI
jgi:hypothetical protein